MPSEFRTLVAAALVAVPIWVALGCGAEKGELAPSPDASAGSAGTQSQGGAGGTAGAAGKSGGAGSGGTAGTAGSSAGGGSGGTAGTGGTGSGGTAGTGGTGSGGTAGTGGAGGQDAGPDAADSGDCYPACSGATLVCLNGVCVECTPSTKRCSSDKQPQTCDPAGAWKDDTPCGGTAPICNNGTCGSMRLRGGIGTLGLAPSTGGTVRLRWGGLENSSRVCSGNVCVSGGIAP